METDEERVLQEVRNFSAKFHANPFVITCRIAAREYTFEQFTEVEVADFDEQQIATFATKWFAAKDPIQGNKFINKLKENRPIRELATNPLLLTLLCLIFEELANFPDNRSELYKEGIDILLKNGIPSVILSERKATKSYHYGIKKIYSVKLHLLPLNRVTTSLEKKK